VSQKLKENILRSEIEETSTATTPVPPKLSELDSRILAALHAAADKKAFNLTILDLRGIATFTDFFIITNGQNRRQVQAISDGIVEHLKKQGTRAARVEGYQTAEWILIDYGDFVVHVFDDKARGFYDLERLWRESARLDVPPEQLAQMGSLKEGK
jgi:ribosome-associated protein